MAAAGAGAACTFQWLFARSSPPKSASIPFNPPLLLPSSPARRPLFCSRRMVSVPASSESNPNTSIKKEHTASPPSSEGKPPVVEDDEEEDVEEEVPWIQEKALDLVEFTGSVTQAIPGPRVGRSSLPLILAIPLAYAGITFVIAFVKTLRKFNSPREKRKKLVCSPMPYLSYLLHFSHLACPPVPIRPIRFLILQTAKYVLFIFTRRFVVCILIFVWLALVF